MIQQLEDKEFKYKNYVTRMNKKGCGTVCCVAGWYPKYFPQTNLVWRLGNLRPKGDYTFTDEELIMYHGLDLGIISLLFYGQSSPLSFTLKGRQVWTSIEKMWKGFVHISPPFFSVENGIDSSKDEVQYIFEFIYYLIDNDYIKYYRHEHKS